MKSEAHAILLQPPTAQELELIEMVSAVSFVLALATITLVIAYSGYLVVKTKLPGRIEVFLGVSLFAALFLWSVYMGGCLEMTLGPLGELLQVIAWSASLVLFLCGHVRMFRRFKRMQNGS